MGETTTFKQFMKKFGGKDVSKFEEILESEYNYDYMGEDLNDKYYWCLSDNFENLSEEEKLKFTAKQAKKIKNARFIKEYFCWIVFAEFLSNKINAKENLRNFAYEIDITEGNFSLHLSSFLISYFLHSNSDSLVNDFDFEEFSLTEVELIIKYNNILPFDVNDLLKQRYEDFECENFLLEIKKNPPKVFDYFIEKIPVSEKRLNGVLIYTYLLMKVAEQNAEQMSERFGKLTKDERHLVIYYLQNNMFNINITQKHVDLINDDDYKRQAQDILDSRNKQEHDTQNVQAKEIEENKSNKICEVIKLFFAILFSFGSIASIIVGAIAFAGLLTLSFSPWILVGVGVPVLLIGGYFFGKSVKNLRNLILIMNKSNVKEESDDNSVIPEEDDKENDISGYEVAKVEGYKNKNDLYQ